MSIAEAYWLPRRAGGNGHAEALELSSHETMLHRKKLTIEHS
jgi:hypothetical protein